MANSCGTAVLPAAREHRIADLYLVAQQKFWRVDTSLDWSHFPDTGAFPFSRAGNRFSGYCEYESLSVSQQRTLAWQLHAAEINDILYGERAALKLAAQMLPACDSLRVQMFLASQVADEARHVEFFARYLRALPATDLPPSVALRDYLHAAVQDSQQTAKQIACQLVLEPLAMIRFRELRSNTKVPLLRQALSYIARDEARHTRFGREFPLLTRQSLSAARGELKLEQISGKLQQLAGDLQLLLDIGRDWGFRRVSLRRHLHQRRCANAAARRQLQHCLQSLGRAFERHRAH